MLNPTGKKRLMAAAASPAFWRLFAWLGLAAGQKVNFSPVYFIPVLLSTDISVGLQVFRLPSFRRFFDMECGWASPWTIRVPSIATGRSYAHAPKVPRYAALIVLPLESDHAF